MKKLTIIVATLGLVMSSGCIFRSKSKTTSQPATVQEEPKNHGQERSAEAHEANAERKEAKEEAKEEKKDKK